ncbi:MAG TPA: helix-turn-helix transcriptional regulator [Ilumatobacter sp.]|nr:helix-turn-helix transcriptional regulator [Ilumatobacter sp.]
MTRSNAGELVRTWRLHRRRSQMDLALDVGVSTRHLSFVETGRSRPSPELLLALADGLDVPLRERNTMLLAAGYAPRYRETPLDDPAVEPVLLAVRRLLDAHDPFPGVAVDRMWNIVQTNASAGALTAGVPAHVLAPQPNIYRLALHPEGLAPRTVNFAEWANSLIAQLRRDAAVTADPELARLLAEVSAYPDVAEALAERIEPQAHDVLVPLVLDMGGMHLSFFTVIATLGTPRDVTLDELTVELFYPADPATAAALRP